MNLLITAIGKRVQLIEYLKKTCTVIGVDASFDNPAKYFVDTFYKVSSFNQISYVDELIDICKKERIEGLIPLHEGEFDVLNENRKSFEKIGTKIILSDQSIISICNNKIETNSFFLKNQIESPKTYINKNELINLDCNKKYIIKPANGMGSAEVYTATNLETIISCYDIIAASDKKPIVQECIEGVEYTVDVLCDFDGIIISVVPRQRLEVRSGEVSKSKTINNKLIIEKTINLIKLLNLSGRVIGPITVQGFLTPDNKFVFIEINPRFGGGVPLTFESGVNYGEYFIHMIKGEKIQPVIGKFNELKMLRYDSAVYEKENRAVIFDLDDTLYEEKSYVNEALKNVANYLEDKYKENSLIKENTIYNRFLFYLEAGSRPRLFDIICNEFGLEEDISMLIKIYRSTTPNISLYKDAIEIINELRKKGYRLGIISNGASLVQHQKVKALNLVTMVDCIIITDDYGHDYWKPSSKPYEKMLEKLEVPVQNSVFVGDNPHKDFIGAREIGMNTIRIIREHGDYIKEKLDRDHEADNNVTLLTELLNII